MAEYYLISQLPSLDGLSESAPLPITPERFQELCHSYLGERALGKLAHLTIHPPLTPTASGSPLIDVWNKGERDLRLVLAKARADKLQKPFDLQNACLPVELARMAAAVDMENPLEAEQFLLQHRLRFLESLRPMDPFCEDYVFYYGLKLKLLSRIRRFDAQLGETAYKNIYSSVLSGDRSEATS